MPHQIHSASLILPALLQSFCQLQTMNQINSKAIELKHKNKKHRSEIREIRQMPQSYSPTLTPSRLPQPRYRMTSQEPSPVGLKIRSPPHAFQGTGVLPEGKKVMIKVITAKYQKTTNRRWKSMHQPEGQLVLTRYHTNCSQSLELKLNKPTDRRFHQLNNIRIAESILFAKPSDCVNHQSLQSFFKRQRQYKKNIARMPALKMRFPCKKKSKEWLL